MDAIVDPSVDIYRRLAADCPATFNADLTLSLHRLFKYLSKLGRHKYALDAILESVDLHRQLAADRPAAFNEGLARSLYSLSNHLLDLERREDALEAIASRVCGSISETCSRLPPMLIVRDHFTISLVLCQLLDIYRMNWSLF